MFRRLLSPAGVAALAAAAGLTTGTALAAPPGSVGVRPGPVGVRPGLGPVGVGVRPFVPGASVGHYGNIGRLGVWPGASFGPNYGVGNFGYPGQLNLGIGNFGYPNRFNLGYANSNFALSIGVGNPLYRGYAGYPGYYGYRFPWMTAGAVPVYVPFYVPVPTGPDVPPGGDLVPAVPQGQVQADYRPAAPTVPSTGAARIMVQVPAGAQLWVDDQPTAQTGAVREFVTPTTLEPGRSYQYKLRAQWQQNGQTVTRERTVEFKADSSAIVNFNVESP